MLSRANILSVLQYVPNNSEVPLALTRLEQFIHSRGIKPAHLARESGYSRVHLYRIRMGLSEPQRAGRAAIVAACRRLSRESIRASDLFDLEGSE